MIHEQVVVGPCSLDGELIVPGSTHGLVVFADSASEWFATHHMAGSGE